MTIDFITGKAGTDHIDGDDWRGMNASMVGLDDYVMKLRNQLAITVQDSNHVVIDTGMAMMNGGAANVTAAETVTVQSGTQGQKRNDLIVLRYTRTNSIEKAQLVCLRGTPTTGTPADPSYNRQSILLGSTTVHDMPLYRLPLNGITLGTPVKLFRTLGSLSEVWDSLTQRIDFDRSGTTTASDPMAIGGQVFTSDQGALAMVTVRWVNNGSFYSDGWAKTRLAKMVGWRATRETVQVCSENVEWEHVGKNFIQCADEWINWMPSGGWQVPENAWHNCSLVFPVERV